MSDEIHHIQVCSGRSVVVVQAGKGQGGGRCVKARTRSLPNKQAEKECPAKANFQSRQVAKRQKVIREA